MHANSINFKGGYFLTTIWENYVQRNVISEIYAVFFKQLVRTQTKENSADYAPNNNCLPYILLMEASTNGKKTAATDQLIAHDVIDVQNKRTNMRTHKHRNKFFFKQTKAIPNIHIHLPKICVYQIVMHRIGKSIENHRVIENKWMERNRRKYH